MSTKEIKMTVKPVASSALDETTEGASLARVRTVVAALKKNVAKRLEDNEIEQFLADVAKVVQFQILKGSEDEDHGSFWFERNGGEWRGPTEGVHPMLEEGTGTRLSVISYTMSKTTLNGFHELLANGPLFLNYYIQARKLGMIGAFGAFYHRQPVGGLELLELMSRY